MRFIPRANFDIPYLWPYAVSDLIDRRQHVIIVDRGAVTMLSSSLREAFPVPIETFLLVLGKRVLIRSVVFKVVVSPANRIPVLDLILSLDDVLESLTSVILSRKQTHYVLTPLSFYKHIYVHTF